MTNSILEKPETKNLLLPPEAFYGLAGDVVRVLEPHTEADPASILLQLLVAYGNAIERSAHFEVEDTKHYTNEFLVLVGDSSKSRKGTSWRRILKMFTKPDKQWMENRNYNGLSTGEGLIHTVRDALSKKELDKTTGLYRDVIVDHGVVDKRLMVVEEEFSRVLRVMRRDGNTLSPLIREAWDTGNLRVMTKVNPEIATRAHVSLICHITDQELLRYMSETDYGNGFGNRFLWAFVERSNILPFGGQPNQTEYDQLIDRLGKAVMNGKNAQQTKFSPAAAELWSGIYRELSQGYAGLLGSMVSRAEAHTVRLSLIYALLDNSKEIRLEHLLAAVAVWNYCEDSARKIFGDALGEPIADKILSALRDATNRSLNRTQIHDLFSRHKTDEEIDRASLVLRNKGLIRVGTTKTGGRDMETWEAA